MVKITISITIESNPGEDSRTFIRLDKEGLINGTSDVEEGEQVSVESPESLSSWTLQEVSGLLSRITPDARRILQEIAQHPNGYAFHDLQAAMNMDGLKIAGRLSSLGHRLAGYKGKMAPVTRDYSRRAYFMLPEVAQAIRELQQS